jgi:cardiolipin synthase
MDAIGSPPVSRSWADRFERAGVSWHRFSPLGYLGLLKPRHWRRLHRKLCVVDGIAAFCGGINILDDWHDPSFGPLNTARFDFAVRVEGPLVVDIHASMVQLWQRIEVTARIEEFALKAAHQLWKSRQRGPGEPTERVKPLRGGARAALVLRDNLRNRTRIERSYRKAIAGARQEILIANAYFLPGAKLRRALIHAACRGVRVRLLLQGRYEYFMQFHAARPVLLALLKAGVEIHEYTAGFLHAKVAVVDGRWATVGSSNLDPLSLLLAREANIVAEDAPFADELRECLERALGTSSVKLDALHYAARPWSQRVLDWLAYGLMRAALFLNRSRY